MKKVVLLALLALVLTLPELSPARACPPGTLFSAQGFSFCPQSFCPQQEVFSYSAPTIVSYFVPVVTFAAQAPLTYQVPQYQVPLPPAQDVQQSYAPQQSYMPQVQQRQVLVQQQAAVQVQQYAVQQQVVRQRVVQDQVVQPIYCPPQVLVRERAARQVIIRERFVERQTLGSRLRERRVAVAVARAETSRGRVIVRSNTRVIVR